MTKGSFSSHLNDFIYSRLECAYRDILRDSQSYKEITKKEDQIESKIGELIGSKDNDDILDNLGNNICILIRMHEKAAYSQGFKDALESLESEDLFTVKALRQVI